MIHDFILKNKKILAVLFFLGIGVYWRSRNWPSFSLGFDQVQIIQQAEKILNGKATLIGPRTGPAATFTGPLIYYLTAFFQLFIGPTTSAVVVPIFLSTLTALLIYFLSQKYLKSKHALIALAVWSISPFLIALDRIFWNPNLTLAALSLIIFPISFSQKSNKKDLKLIFLGSFLSYQAHFSAFLIPPAVLILVFLFKKDKRIILANILGLAISLLPTLIFDLRHDWMNLNGILHLLNNQDSVNGFNISLIVNDFLKNLSIALESLGRLIVELNSFKKRLILGMITFIFLIWQNRKQLKKISFQLLFACLVCLFFSFYNGSKPEYYFLIIIPSLLTLLVLGLEKINNSLLIVLYLFLLVFNQSAILKQEEKNLGLGLGQCLAIAQEVESIQKKAGLQSVDYLLPHASDFGLKYLIERLEKNNAGLKIQLVNPIPKNQTQLIKKIGDTAIIVKNNEEDIKTNLNF